MAFSWYIVQAHSGYEKKVSEAIKEKAEREGLSANIEEIVVPVESVVEVKKGKKISSERKFYPGYVLVKMAMDDKTWHLIKSVPKVSGFLGSRGRPQAIPQREIDDIFKQMEDGLNKPKNLVAYQTGESVKIIDGPFDTFVGTVEDVDDEKGKLKVSVTIFGRTTPVELEYSQVEKV